MILEKAREIAEKYKEQLRPFCKRIEIAGSIRREKPEVKDIEICTIVDPKYMFRFQSVVEQWTRIKGDPLGKYTCRMLPEGIKLDLFNCSELTWGCIFLIRTGSADFSRAVMAQSYPYKFMDGRLYRVIQERKNGYPKQDLVKMAAIFDEDDVFRALGYEWIHPRERIDGRSIILSHKSESGISKVARGKE